MQDFSAKLSDFGLAREAPTGDRTHVSTQVLGTQGYAAPEYIATGLTCAWLFSCFLILKTLCLIISSLHPCIIWLSLRKLIWLPFSFIK